MLELTGQKFHKLTVSSETRVGGKRSWLCQCECGGSTVTTSAKLKSGHTQSCGCYKLQRISETKKTHGLTKGRTWNAWSQMKARCTSATSSRVERYIERGIGVCDRWHLFDNFLADMGENPGRGYSLDRINNNDGYYKENCQWATNSQQQRNKRSTVRYDFLGENLTLVEIIEKTGAGISLPTLWARVAIYKWPIERAVFQPVG